MEVIELSASERVVRVRFNRVVYRRYPRAKQWSDRMYFRAGRGDVLKGRGYLHRDIWVAARGAIPDGYEVDHRDGNPLNNELGNLQLLSAAEHAAKHAPLLAERARERMHAMPASDRKRMLDGAAAWHRSAEGRECHRRHAVSVAARMDLADLVRSRCACEYRAKANIASRSGSHFCSTKCRAAARRASGSDDESRTCACGATFTCNRYSKQRSCSRSCAHRHAHRKATPGVQPDGR